MRLARTALLLGLLVAVLPSRAYAAADPVLPHPPSPLAGLPDDVGGGQVVTLADGDRYEVTRERRGRSIRGRRWDAATAVWGPLQVIFKAPDLRCWGVLARGSGTGVAVRVECDKWGTGVDGEGEGRPYAIVSADTRNWQSSELPGYGSWEPGIAPSGTRAVWSDKGDYLTWDSASGFVRHVATPPVDLASDEAPVITDDGAVTIAYVDTRCTVTFDAYLAPEVPIRQTLPTTMDCDLGVAAIDAHTVAFGDQREWGYSLLTRPDDMSPWGVSIVAPLFAPGLLPDTVHPTLSPVTLDADDGPLAAVSNGPGELRVQVYDPTTQSWRPPTTLATRAGGPRCSFKNAYAAEIGLYAVLGRCAGPDLLATSPDGGTWTATTVRTQALGTNYRLRLAAAASRTQTVVVGREGVETLPFGTSGRCDVVFPIAAGRVLRLTASNGSHGWPDVLQRSTATGWRTIRRVAMPTEGRCRRVDGSLGALGEPWHAFLDRGSVGLRFRKVEGRWDVRVARWGG